MTRSSEHGENPDQSGETRGGERTVSAVALANRVEADLVTAVLRERGIPYVLVTHDVLFYEGVYNVREGWGHIDAPESYREEIVEVYRDLISPDSIGPE